MIKLFSSTCLPKTMYIYVYFGQILRLLYTVHWKSQYWDGHQNATIYHCTATCVVHGIIDHVFHLAFDRQSDLLYRLRCMQLRYGIFSGIRCNDVVSSFDCYIWQMSFTEMWFDYFVMNKSSTLSPIWKRGIWLD